MYNIPAPPEGKEKFKVIFDMDAKLLLMLDMLL